MHRVQLYLWAWRQWMDGRRKSGSITQELNASQFYDLVLCLRQFETVGNSDNPLIADY